MTSTTDGSREPNPVMKRLLSVAGGVLGIAIFGSIVAGAASLMKRLWTLVTGNGWQGDPFDQYLGLEGRLGGWQRFFEIDSLWWLFLFIPFALFKLIEAIEWLVDPRARADARARSKAQAEDEKRSKKIEEERRAARRQAKMDKAASRGPSLLRRATRKVWNGPFSTPPIPSPVTVGWVLLKALETIWRALVTLVVAAFVIGAGAYLWSLANPPLREQLSISASFGADCEKDMPLRLEVANNSSRTVNEWSLRFSAFEKDRSTDLAKHGYGINPKTFDYVIKPNEVIVLCSTLPALDSRPEGPVSYHPRIEWATEAG